VNCSEQSAVYHLLNMHYSELGVTGATVIANIHHSKSCIFFSLTFYRWQREFKFWCILYVNRKHYESKKINYKTLSTLGEIKLRLCSVS